MALKLFADRLAELVDERRSQICLGLDPDPAQLAGEGDGSRRCPGGRAGRRRSGHPLSRPDRPRRPCLCCGQAAARVLRATRRCGMGGSGHRLSDRSRSWPADDRRRQARRRAGYRRGLRPGAGRRDADPLGRGLGDRRRRLHRQPPARPRRPRAIYRRGGQRGRRRLRPRPHQQSRRRRRPGPAGPGAAVARAPGRAGRRSLGAPAGRAAA